MCALIKKIAILWQNAKVDNAFAKETELETGNTAEVRLITNFDWEWMKVIWLDVIYSVLCGYNFQ